MKNLIGQIQVFFNKIGKVIVYNIDTCHLNVMKCHVCGDYII